MRHLHATRNAGNTKADADRRVRERLAGERAHAEALAKFGAVTGANFQEACDWQEMRRRQLLGGAP